MQVHTYLAESVADAVSQIRETLGPEAVARMVKTVVPQLLAFEDTLLHLDVLIEWEISRSAYT